MLQYGGVEGSVFTGAACAADWAGNGDTPSVSGSQGDSAVREPFFTPWISVAGAAVEGAGLTHPWERGRAGIAGGEASRETFEKHR